MDDFNDAFKRFKQFYNVEPGFQDGGSVTTSKRGLVDEPGSYGGLKKDGTPKSEYMIKGSRLPKGKLTLYNKYAQLFFNKDWKDLTETESEKVENASRKGKFIKTNKFDQLTDLNQEKIKKAFPDIKFEFKPGQKLGVPKTLPNGKLNPVNDAVSKFIRRGYKKSLRKSLPVSIQRDIVANFELPKGVKEWNFDVNQGGNTYGIPDTGQNNAKNRNLGARIKRFVENPINYKVAADYSTPDGWLLNQMYRAHLYNDNYIPKYDLINGKKKIVAFTDNQFGKGKTYYALKKYANKFNGIPMSEHPDYQNTKKYINIANKARLSPNEVIKDLLIKGGVKDDRITLNTLLNFIINKKGVEPTKRALVLHHKGGMSSPTRDFQILNAAVNQNIVGIEKAMRSNPKNITPENIKKLKDFGASITIDGTTYGGGPKTAMGGFRQGENLVQSKLEGYGKKDFAKLKKYLAAMSRNPKCKAGFFSGGRVGFQDGSVSLDFCARDGAKVVNSGKFAKGAEARNAAKFLNRAYKMGKWVWNWGVVPEAVFAGGDALIRMGYGATLDEGLLKATDFLFSGNQTLKADVLEIERQLGGEAAEVFRNVGNWKDRKDELESIKQQRASDHAVAGTDFAETNSGMSSAEVDKYWDPIQTAKEKEVRDASVSAPKDEQILAESYFEEAYDKSAADSLFSKIAFYKNQNEKPMSQVGTLPDKTQVELNKRMSPQNFTRDMLTREPEIYHQVMDNLKKDLYPHQYFWDEKENFENIKSDKGVSEAQGHYNLSLALLDQALKKPLSSHVLDDGYTKEQVYGTQEGRGFLEKLNRKKFIRPGVFNATSNQLDDIYDMGRQGAASGGIAGVRRPNAIAPESGPAPQGEGLSYILNRVREW